MPKWRLGDFDSMWGDLSSVPTRAPRKLERLASICLSAGTQDSRLGDLSELYLRTHARARRRLGTSPWAMTGSHLAADFYYLAATANVTLCARAVDPILRATENVTVSLVAIDLRERTMTMLRVVTGRLVMPSLLLLGGALLVNSAIDVWSTWRQTETFVASVQLDKANAAAARIEQFLGAVQSQTAWTTFARLPPTPLEQRRVASLLLLRQTPAITEVAQLDSAGREELWVSRLTRDRIGGGGDFASDVRFKQALEHGVYFSPVYFRNGTEPYLSLAMAHNDRAGVTIAEVNLKQLWDAIGAITVGETGYAYVVDGNGRLIAHRDAGLVLRKPDLATMPQVAAALAGQTSKEPVGGKAVDASGSGASVISAHALVRNLGWHVFVELPVTEARTPLWSALIRVGCILGLALVAALLARLMAARRGTPVHAAPA